MSNYKLIKKYPNSPSVGTEVYVNNHGEADTNVIIFYPHTYPEYWQSLKEYKIISRTPLGEITQVLRYSDGEFFKVGDLCKSKASSEARISKIWHCNPGYIRFTAETMWTLGLDNIQHCEKTIITEDGVVLNTGDIYWMRCGFSAIWSYYQKETPHDLIFSTQKAMWYYYENTDKTLSIEDVRKVYPLMTDIKLAKLKSIING